MFFIPLESFQNIDIKNDLHFQFEGMKYKLWQNKEMGSNFQVLKKISYHMEQ